MPRAPTRTGRGPVQPAVTDLPLKWLIPSVAVLFAVVGYVVQSSQESLLGVATADRGNAVYFNAAADFFRESIIRLLTWPSSWLEHMRFHRPRLLIYAVLAVTIAIMLLRNKRLQAFVDVRRMTIVAAALVFSVVAVKFLFMDAPLLKIENLAVGSDESCWSLVTRPSTSSDPSSKKRAAIVRSRCLQMDSAKGVDHFVWEKASQIVGEIVCSRDLHVDAQQLPGAIARSDACMRLGAKDTGSRKKMSAKNLNAEALGDEFLLNLVLTMLTFGGAVATLRTAAAGAGVKAACLFVLLYGFTTPYAYGKVGMTQLFDFAKVRISTNLVDSYQQEYGSAPKRPTLPQNPLLNGRIMTGVVIQKSAAGVTLLTLRRANCNISDDPMRESQLAVQVYVNAAQIMSLDEIYKTDLIEWLVSKQYDCY